MFERKVLGEDYWTKQAALKPALFPSQAQMVDAMIRGEIAIAPLVTNLAIPLAAQGAPLKWFFAPEGVPVTVFCAGIAKGARHPNAAKLFLDWALSREGQALMVELGSFSAMAQAPMPPGVDTKAIKTSGIRTTPRSRRSSSLGPTTGTRPTTTGNKAVSNGE